MIGQIFFLFVFSEFLKNTQNLPIARVSLHCPVCFSHAFSVQSGSVSPREITHVVKPRLTGVLGAVDFEASWVFMLVTLANPCQMICTTVQQRSHLFFLWADGKTPLCKYMRLWRDERLANF